MKLMKLRMKRPGPGFWADNDGAAAVEFALVVSAFLSLILGIAYVSIMAFNTLTIDRAVKLASRQAEINSSATQSDIASTINNYLTANGLSTATVTYTVGLSGGINTANISASYQQNYSIPFIPTIHMTFSSSAVVPQAS
jgi:Flp pilus assembly protein TadG